VSTVSFPSVGSARGSAQRRDGVFTLAAAVVVALLLISAATMKTIDWNAQSAAAAAATEATGEAVAGPGAVALIQPAAEFVIAIGVLVFRRRPVVWALAALMFGGFAGYTFLLAVRGEASCGCFGAWGPPPAVMFAVDMVMLSVCAVLATRDWGFSRARGMVLTLAGAGGVAGAAYAGVSTVAPVTDIDPVAVLTELDVMDAATAHTRSGPQWLVYVYRKTCPVCIEHYPSFKTFADATADDPLVRGLLLEVDDLAEQATAQGLELPAYAWAETPTTLLMRSGQVVRRFGITEIPTPAVLYQELTGKPLDLSGVAAAPPPGVFPAPDAPSAGSAPAAPVVDHDAVVEKLRQVHNSDGSQRFAAIFDDAPGAPYHLLYAHTNCGVCIRYRKDMLETADLVADRIVFHPVMMELLEDNGIATEEWGDAHAALLFDGGELKAWYGTGKVNGDLLTDLYDTVPAP